MELAEECRLNLAAAVVISVKALQNFVHALEEKCPKTM